MLLLELKRLLFSSFDFFLNSYLSSLYSIAVKNVRIMSIISKTVTSSYIMNTDLSLRGSKFAQNTYGSMM